MEKPGDTTAPHGGSASTPHRKAPISEKLAGGNPPPAGQPDDATRPARSAGTPTGGGIPEKSEGPSHTQPVASVAEKSGDPSHTPDTTARTALPEPSHNGWQLQLGSFTLEVCSPHLDRGAIRAALTVREGTAIRYRSMVNLTSESARAKIVKTLTGKGVLLDDSALVALDEVCRRPHPGVARVCDGGADFSEAPPLTLPELEAVFRRWLLIEDDALMPVLTGAVLAHRLRSDPVWLLIVAPPGGTKSELLRSLYDYPGIFPLSSLTARTLASGLDVPAGDQSLLARLTNEILVLKDFTTVLEISHEERQAILAQLREVYDGRFDKVWGTGHEVHWTGRLGFLAGVTPVIDRHQGAMSLLGERFVLFRPRMPDRNALATMALKGVGDEARMRRELVRAMHGFLRARRTAAPVVSEELRGRLAVVADLVTRARSAVVRDGYSRGLEYVPEPEAPTRFAKVLLSLAQGVALAYDSPAPTERELCLVLRVALDCVPPNRRQVFAALFTDVPATAGEAAARIGRSYSETAVYRALEDLEALGLLIGDAASPRRWTLPARWAEVLQLLDAGPGSEGHGGGAGKPDQRVIAESSHSDSPPDPIDNVEATLGLTSLDDPDGTPWRGRRAS